VTEDPATEHDPERRAAAGRRRKVIIAGHAGQIDQARRGLADPHPSVQAAAVGALARAGALSVADVVTVMASEAPIVRRAAVESALQVRGPGSRSVLVSLVIASLKDPDELVVVGATWFVGERRTLGAVLPLAAVATDHPDVRCREAAVAALGAIGDPLGLPAVLAALDDKATIRRRATVALAGFDGPQVEAALHSAANDRDWQVRQAAEELLND